MESLTMTTITDNKMKLDGQGIVKAEITLYILSISMLIEVNN